MPTFIEQHGDPQIPPPYGFPGITITSLRLDADIGPLRQMCDRLLNIGTLQQRGFEFRPLIPYVDLEVVIYPRMECTAPPYAGYGYMTQNEIYFRFFVIKHVLLGGILYPTTEIGCFFPYIFVDNPWSAIAGRGVLGFTKNLARFDVPKSGPYPIKVSTQVLSNYSANTPLEWKQVIAIDASTTGGGAPLPTSPWPWGELLGLNPLLQNLIDASGILQQSLFSAVLLKQFRDGQTPSNACYQAITQSTFAATNITNTASLPQATVTLTPAASLPIANTLGLSGNTLTPVWQYTLRCDMTFGNTQNLFVAP